MKLIDTHCHFCNGRLRQQVDDVLDRARKAGLVAAICAAADLQESTAALALARRVGWLYCTAGVHPHEAQEVPGDYLQRVERLCSDTKNVAVGEIGLDYHYNYSPPEAQRRVFAEQLDLAARIDKKVVIHTREAVDDTLAVLNDSPVDGRNVVFHSCTVGPDEIGRVLELGAMVSFSGIVTFARADDLRLSAAMVPIDRLMIETDAPFLSPVPVRKMKTNEPANVMHVAACLAEVLHTTTEQLAERTTANAVRFFGLDIDGEGQ